jgi:hypothetical protein
MPSKKKKARKQRPPRVHVDKKGRRYIRVKKRKYYISKHISERSLIQWLIKRFQRKRKTVKKDVKKLNEIALMNAPKNQVLQPHNLRPDTGIISYFNHIKNQSGTEDTIKQVKADIEAKKPNHPLLKAPKEHKREDSESEEEEEDDGYIRIPQSQFNELREDAEAYRTNINLFGEQTAEAKSKLFHSEDETKRERQAREKAEGEIKEKEEALKRHRELLDQESERRRKAERQSVEERLIGIEARHQQLEAQERKYQKDVDEQYEKKKILDFQQMQELANKYNEPIKKARKKGKRGSDKLIKYNGVKPEVLRQSLIDVGLINEGKIREEAQATRQRELDQIKDVRYQLDEEEKDLRAKLLQQTPAKQHHQTTYGFQSPAPRSSQSASILQPDDESPTTRSLRQNFILNQPTPYVDRTPSRPLTGLSLGSDTREEDFEKNITTRKPFQHKYVPARSVSASQPTVTIRHEIHQIPLENFSEPRHPNPSPSPPPEEEEEEPVLPPRVTFHTPSKVQPPPGPPPPPPPPPPEEEEEPVLPKFIKTPPKSIQQGIKEGVKLRKTEPIEKKQEKRPSFTEPSDDLRKHLESRRAVVADDEDDFQEGSGEVEKGLYDNQINTAMRHYKGYKGTVASDEITTKILPKVKPKSKGAFIMNLDPSNKPGSHWVGIFYDATPGGSKTIEYDDSFGRSPSHEVTMELKQLSEQLGSDDYLKFKVNRVTDQRANSQSCGYLAMLFVRDRLGGKSFKQATGYDSVTDAEKRAMKLKHQLGFGLI